MVLRRIVVVLATLVAFSANSILCRLALRDSQIDAATFTSIRILAGAIALFCIVVIPKHKTAKSIGGSWMLAMMLFGYAAAFSFAYIDVNASTGGLILFGTVQATMVLLGIMRGERPGLSESIGLAIALIGLVYLFFPRLESPSLMGGGLMTVAGVCWGFYSIFGKSQTEPEGATAGNFIRAVPFAIILFLVFISQSHATPNGVALAVVSGAITSGLGYILWYQALAWLTPTRSAVLQLLVPVLVALESAVFLGESLSWSLIWASCLILGGAMIAILGKTKRTT